MASDTTKEKHGLSLDASPEDVRAVSLSYILQGAGASLANASPAGLGGQYEATGKDQDPYLFSKAVAVLDFFLSHSWADGRWAKFFILLFACNHQFALVLGVIASCAWLAAEMAGMPSPVWFNAQLGLTTGPPMLLFTMVYLVALIFGHKLFHSVSEQTIFLDKACICQSDLEKKEAGIRALGATVAATKQLLICASTKYFERLWCNYEIAIFLRIRGAQSVRLYSTKFPLFFLVGLVLTMVSNYFAVIDLVGLNCNTGSETVDALLAMVLSVVGYVFCDYQLAGAAIDNLQVLATLKQFSLGEAKCFCCSVDHCLEDGTCIGCDRVLVEEHIEALYGSIEEFNDAVRTDMRQVIKDAISSDMFMFPTMQLWVYTFLMVLSNVEYAVFLPAGEPRNAQLIATFTFYVSILFWQYFVISFICRAAAALVSPSVLHTGCIGTIFRIIVSLVTVCMFALMISWNTAVIFEPTSTHLTFWVANLLPGGGLAVGFLTISTAKHVLQCISGPQTQRVSTLRLSSI